MNDILFIEGFEDAVIGLGYQFNTSLVVYDYDKCIKILMERESLSTEDAKSWMSHNLVGSWLGRHTPVFVHVRENYFNLLKAFQSQH